MPPSPRPALQILLPEISPFSRRSSSSAATEAAIYRRRAADAMDPFTLLIRIPYSFLRIPRLRLKIPSFQLPSAMTLFSLVLLSYFLVVSGFVYDVIAEPPGIGSRQDPVTGAFQPVVFMSGRVNAQYIIEGLSSGFMFVLGGIGVIMLDLAVDNTRARNLRLAFVAAGVTFVFIAYLMSMLFIRIKIPSYLR